MKWSKVTSLTDYNQQKREIEDGMATRQNILTNSQKVLDNKKNFFKVRLLDEFCIDLDSMGHETKLKKGMRPIGAFNLREIA